MEMPPDNDRQRPSVGADGTADPSAFGPARPRALGNATPHAGSAVDKLAGQARSGRSRREGRLNSQTKYSRTGKQGGRGRTARAGEPDASIWFRLTDRDHLILSLLDQHKVLTTEQIAAAEFRSVRRAQDRLAQLRTLGLVFGFRESYRDGGTSQTRFALGYLGARAIAAQRAENPPTKQAHQRALERLAWWPKLGHQLGVNGFFCDLVARARRTRDATPKEPLGSSEPGGLKQWWSEQRCTLLFWNRDVKLRPDGYGCWVEHGRWVRFFLEYDTGTEALSKVTHKITDYATFPTDAFGILLFSVHSTKREIALRHALRRQAGSGHQRLVIATTARDLQHPDGPAGPVWSLWSPDRGDPVAQRLRLAELPERGPRIEPHAPWPGQPYSEAAFDPSDRKLVDLAESGHRPRASAPGPAFATWGDGCDDVILSDDGLGVHEQP